MNAGESLSEAEDLEHEADVARQQVDRTLDELAERVSLRRRASKAAGALRTAAARAYRNASPEVTTLIRLDHTHVLAAFRRYHIGSYAARKRALSANVCRALEIHAQLEQEIFYPALSGISTGAIEKSVQEHAQMRSLIEELRATSPTEAAHDEIFARLIRTVLHHVAEEETILIPLAEARLKDQLRELGWRMTARRLQLLRPHAAEVATTTALTFPVATTLVAVGTCAAVWMLVRRLTAPRR